MKPSEERLQKLASDYLEIADLVNHPGWRDLIEKPLDEEIKWTETELRNIMDGIEQDPRMKWENVREYRKALYFVKNQIFLRIKMGREAQGTLAMRAEQMGLKEKDEIKVPTFQEVQ